MSYASDVPPTSLYSALIYPSHGIFGAQGYELTNIEENVTSLFNGELCRPREDLPLHPGWSGCYSPSPLGSQPSFHPEGGFTESDASAYSDVESWNSSPSMDFCPSPSSTGDRGETYAEYYDSNLLRHSAVAQPPMCEAYTTPSSLDGSARAHVAAAPHIPSKGCDSDIDAESQADRKCGIDDDEYIPPTSKRTRTLKLSASNRRRASNSPKTSISRSSRPSRSSRSELQALYLSSSSVTTPLTPTAARMKQVSEPFVPLSPSVLRAMKCPICNRQFPPTRESDLRRHYECHYHTEEFVCQGVHIDHAAEYGITDVSGGREFRGEMRVGECCWKVFSRRDALKRHLNNPKLPCVSDIL